MTTCLPPLPNPDAATETRGSCSCETERRNRLARFSASAPSSFEETNVATWRNASVSVVPSTSSRGIRREAGHRTPAMGRGRAPTHHSQPRICSRTHAEARPTRPEKQGASHAMHSVCARESQVPRGVSVPLAAPQGQSACRGFRPGPRVRPPNARYGLGFDSRCFRPCAVVAPCRPGGTVSPGYKESRRPSGQRPCAPW